MPLPLLLLGVGTLSSAATLVGGRLFGQKPDGTVTVAKEGSDIVLSPELLLIAAAGVALWHFSRK